MKFPAATLPWPIAIEAVDLIATSEQGPHGGLALTAYQCPAGKWTIGFGRTTDVCATTTCSAWQADRWLCDELTARAAVVGKLCKQPPTPRQLGAMVSLHYNIGSGNFASSSVLREHNAGRWEAAGKAFYLWNGATVQGRKVTLPGLTKRRAAEAALYIAGSPVTKA